MMSSHMSHPGKRPHHLHLHSVFILSLLTLVACGGGGGGGSGGGGGNEPPDRAGDRSTAVRSSILASGDSTCPNGGILVESGIDENGNGLLDDAEVDESEKVCNGQDGRSGLNSLVTFSDEPAGTNCPYGGMRLDSGLDTNENGSLDSDEITQTRFVCSYATGDFGWQVAERIKDSGPNPSSEPRIAYDPDGSVVAVWAEGATTGSENLMVNRYVPGYGWGRPQSINGPTPYAIYDPQITIDNESNAIAVWWEFDGTRYNILASHYSPLYFSWGPPQKIEKDDSGDAESPKVAFDGNGSAIAVWRQNDGVRWSIRTNRYSPETGWSTAATTISNAAGDADEPQIAVNASGDAIAVWGQFDGTKSTIWASRYSSSTRSWSTPEVIVSNTTDSAGSPRIAMDPDGNAIAVWVQGDKIWANRYTASSGSWGAAVPIMTSSKYRFGYHQIAMDPDGNAIVVWEQAEDIEGSYVNIWANRYTPTAGWGRASLIETNNSDIALRPQVAFDAKGNAIAVWQQRERLWDIWSNRYTPAYGWGTAKLVEDHDDASAFAYLTPQIAVHPGGDAMVVWWQNEGQWDLWSNRWLAP